METKNIAGEIKYILDSHWSHSDQVKAVTEWVFKNFEYKGSEKEEIKENTVSFWLFHEDRREEITFKGSDADYVNNLVKDHNFAYERLVNLKNKLNTEGYIDWSSNKELEYIR